MTYLEEYWELIKRGDVVVGYWIKKEIKNLIDDLYDSKYIYDVTEAHKRLKFQEKLCLQSKAPFYMKPISHMPWEKAWWEAIYSFKMKDTNLKRFTEALLLIGRKNGKSTTLAGDGMTDLFIGDGGTCLCCASNDDKQARLIWEEIGGMRSRLDPKKIITGQNLTKIKNINRNIEIIRLSSKTQNKDGFNLSKVYLDESHDMADDEIAEACWRGMSSQDEPLFINCTTEGFEVDGYLDKKIDYAKKVISGEIEDIHFLPFLYLQDSEQEIWQNKKSWEKSNPSLRYGVKKIAKLERDIEIAKFDKASRMHLLTKDFNIKVGNSEAWLSLEDYDYPMEKFDLEDFRNAFALGAVDLSATTDLTSAKIMLMKPNDKTKYIHSHYWIPEKKLEDSNDKSAGAKYKEWARQKFMTICSGNEVDITDVADWYYRLYKNYGIRLFICGYDQRYAKEFLKRMDSYGFDCEMLAQGRALSNAMKLTEAELKGRVINYNENPIDKWCLGNCGIEIDNKEDIQPVKVKGQASMRIDGALTFIMLYEVLRRFRSDFMIGVKKQERR